MKTCTDCGAEHSNPKRRQCPSCVYQRKKAKVDAWRAENADRVRELGRESRRRRYGPARDAAIAHLGGACSRCGFSDERALEIDHALGGGTKQRNQIDRVSFFRQILEGKHPDAQLLCLNCHRIKNHEDYHAPA